MSTPVPITAGVTPPVTLGSPPVPRSGPAPYGLYSVTEDPEDTIDPHWVNSVLWEHQACAAASGVSGTCATFPNITRNLSQQNSTQATATAFHVYGSHVCNPVGYTADELYSFALRNLLDHEQEFVESAISSGSLGSVPSFTDTDNPAVDITPSPGNAVDLEPGFGLLSAYAAATFGSPGSVIHSPRIVSGYAQKIPVERDGNIITTLTSERVSFGAGYENQAPDGTPAAEDEAWLYVTPPPFLLQSDPRDYDTTSVAAALNRANNDFTTLTERTILIGWDNCPIAAVLVNLPGIPIPL